MEKLEEFLKNDDVTAEDLDIMSQMKRNNISHKDF